jgi:hypothetical protein
MKRWVLIAVILVAAPAALAIPALAPEHRAADDSQEAKSTDSRPTDAGTSSEGAKIDQTGYIKGLYMSSHFRAREHAREALAPVNLKLAANIFGYTACGWTMTWALVSTSSQSRPLSMCSARCYTPPPSTMGCPASPQTTGARSPTPKIANKRMQRVVARATAGQSKHRGPPLDPGLPGLRFR